MASPDILRELLAKTGITFANRASDAIGAAAYVIPTVGVIGQQKQGKSSLINALLASDVLPADSLPATAASCEMSFGPNFTAEFQEAGAWHRIAWTDRAQIIDQNLLGSRAAPDTVRLRFPNDLLRDCSIIDTPGTGSRFAEHVLKAKATFIRIDLFVLVTSLHRPIGCEDLNLLEGLPVNTAGVIAVINKVDTALNEDEPDLALQNAMAFLAATLKDAGVEAIDLVPTHTRALPALEYGDNGINRLRKGVRNNAMIYGVLAHVERIVVSMSERYARAKDELKQRLATKSGLSRQLRAYHRILAAAQNTQAEKLDRLKELRKDFVADVDAAGKAAERAFLDILPEDSQITEKWRVTPAWLAVRHKAQEACHNVESEYRDILESTMESVCTTLGCSQRIASRVLKDVPSFLIDISIPETPPGASLTDPGFLSGIFSNLHAVHVRQQFGKNLTQSLKAYDTSFDLRYNTVVESFFVVLEEELKSSKSTAELEVSARLRDIEPALALAGQNAVSQVRAARKDRERVQIASRFKSYAESWRRACDGDLQSLERIRDSEF